MSQELRSIKDFELFIGSALDVGNRLLVEAFRSALVMIIDAEGTIGGSSWTGVLSIVALGMGFSGFGSGGLGAGIGLLIDSSLPVNKYTKYTHFKRNNWAEY